MRKAFSRQSKQQAVTHDDVPQDSDAEVSVMPSLLSPAVVLKDVDSKGRTAQKKIYAVAVICAMEEVRTTPPHLQLLLDTSLQYSTLLMVGSASPAGLPGGYHHTRTRSFP